MKSFMNSTVEGYFSAYSTAVKQKYGRQTALEQCASVVWTRKNKPSLMEEMKRLKVGCSPPLDHSGAPRLQAALLGETRWVTEAGR